MVQPVIKTRTSNLDYTKNLIEAGTHPLLARLWAARGLNETESYAWAQLIAPNQLTNIDLAAKILAQAIEQHKKLLIIADYDCDGATACAVAIRALRYFGANVDFLVPNRFETGYGLSPEVVDLACRHPSGKPDLLITVDNGIASIDGVLAAKKQDIDVIVTDHHLPGSSLPDALAIVNPNNTSCSFPSKNLAGVGVIFYVMLALRALLREQGKLPPKGGPRLDQLADLVALGTVADVVKLDNNNRLLVSQGLAKIRQGKLQAGMQALFQVAGRDYRKATAQDLGFALGPRINAAGRMADMSLGINCLIEDDPEKALKIAQELDLINRQRKTKQTTMSDQAIANLNIDQNSASICVWQNDWHAGIVGLVASKLKETYWRPTIAFAPDQQGVLKGSGRSIAEVHLRDAIDLVSKRLPDAILQFGGHAMAAGLSLKPKAFTDFSKELDKAVKTLSGGATFEPIIETDGSLDAIYFEPDIADLINQQIWGAGFPEPIFVDEFKIIHQQILKDAHLKLFLEKDGVRVNAIWFNHNELLPETIYAAYKLNNNDWGGKSTIQLLIEYAYAA